MKNSTAVIKSTAFADMNETDVKKFVLKLAENGAFKSQQALNACVNIKYFYCAIIYIKNSDIICIECLCKYYAIVL